MPARVYARSSSASRSEIPGLTVGLVVLQNAGVNAQKKRAHVVSPPIVVQEQVIVSPPVVVQGLNVVPPPPTSAQNGVFPIRETLSILATSPNTAAASSASAVLSSMSSAGLNGQLTIPVVPAGTQNSSPAQYSQSAPLMVDVGGSLAGVGSLSPPIVLGGAGRGAGPASTMGSASTMEARLIQMEAALRNLQHSGAQPARMATPFGGHQAVGAFTSPWAAAASVTQTLSPQPLVAAPSVVSSAYVASSKADKLTKVTEMAKARAYLNIHETYKTVCVLASTNAWEPAAYARGSGAG